MELKVNYFSKWLLIMFAVSLCNVAIAQRAITGTVTDAATGESLIGANVLVKGTSSGTITDFDGAYSINLPAGATELEFSYTGYTSQTVAVGNNTVVNISLSAGELLGEVVVVGYGSVRKSDATGAVTSVTEEDFNKGVITSPEQLIQGRAAGVQITTSSGEPGAGVNIRIRGTSSVRGGNNPLFVVDGVPLSGGDVSAGGSAGAIGSSQASNPLNFLNPNDIASIDILKDASATAIYGSRGANGVVLITTKSGKSEKGVLDYSYGLSVSNISKRYDLLDAGEYLQAVADINGQAQADLQNNGAVTDWQDEVFRTAFAHDHNLSYGAGSKEGSYRFSLSYLDQDGIVQNSNIKRYSARFNGDRKFINDRLRIATQFTMGRTENSGVPITDNAGFEGDLLGATLKANPTTSPERDEDGNFFQNNISEPNPAAMLALTRDETSTLRVLGNISAELQIVEGLTFKSVVGFDQSASERKSAYSRDLNFQGIVDRGRLFTGDISSNNQTWENYFTYDRNTENISFNGILGYSYQSFNASGKFFQASNFRTSDLDLMMNNMASANQSTNSVVATNSFQNTDELQSFFGRVNIGFNNKYNLTATLRADGSTRFGGDNKYGYFPAFAFKWRLIEENFVPSAFSDLGLRLGYGITGNQEIPHNLYQERQRYGDWGIDAGGNVNGGGLGTVAFPNPGLKWESTSQINVGVDFGFAKNRVSGSVDYYYKNTNDLLIQITSAQPAVAPFVWTNLDADVINTGVELSLNIVAVDSKDFRWDVLLNGAYNKNIVNGDKIGLINTGEINGQGLTGAFAQRIADGQPLFAFFLRDFGGFDEEGVSIYPNGDFQEFVGNSLPTFNAGFTNNFSYKNFDMSIFFSGQFGNSIYNNTANAFFTAGALANSRNVTRDVIGNGESRLNAPDVSTRFLEDGSFIRLQNLSLGYRVNTGKSSVVSNLRLFIAAQNLFVITNYSGQDPEVNTNKSLNGIPSFGIDYTPYPRARTVTFGANVSF